MKIEQIMSREVACCTAQTTLREAAMMMLENDCGEIPVVDRMDSRRPVGVITDRDITLRAVAEGRDSRATLVGACMTAQCIAVKPGTSVEECCSKMEAHQIRRMLVVDAEGCLCGVVSQADIARHAPTRTTAEVVKEVSKQRQPVL